MKKISVLVALSVVFVCGYVRAEEVSTAEKLSQILSGSYGNKVAVEVKDAASGGEKSSCSISYPEVTIEDEITEYAQPKTPDEEPVAVTKKETTTIPATKAECTQMQDFNGHAQYKVKISSPQKFIAQLYNLLHLSMLKDIEIKSYNEEFQIVPELGLVSYNNTHFADASYVEKDETTGLKSEIGNLKEYSLIQKISDNGEQVKYDMDTSFDSLNVALPFFSLQIKSEKHSSQIEYTLEKGKTFDYEQIVNNLGFLTSAKSSAVVNGVKIGADLFDVGISFDSEAKNNTSSSDRKSINSYGNTLIKNIVFSGEVLESYIGKEKQPKSLALEYSFKNIPVESLNELKEIQLEKMNAADPDAAEPAANDNDEQIAKLLDKVADKAKFIIGLNVKFANADILMEGLFERKNGYLYGVSSVKVNHLFNIFPEKKQCINNPKAMEIPECVNDLMFIKLKDMIDTTKDNSETVYKYTEQGVFKNDTKIGEPIELNFEKMYRENKAREEKLRQSIEEQNAANNVAE